MGTIDNFIFKDKRALVRVDFNVPLDDHLMVTDDTRIVAAKPTIAKILADGGSVVLMSHLGRPKGIESKYSLRHILDKVSEVLGTAVQFAGDCIGQESFQASQRLKPGEVLLLENLRFYAEEQAGDLHFAKELSRHGDVYVNDAFGTAHRAHASTAVIARFFADKFFGYLMAAEIENLHKVLNSSDKPVTAILGGAKVSSKITIIENILDKVDNLIIGGGMAYTFVKAQGGKIGNSLVENDYQETALDIIKKARQKDVKLYLPVDSVVADAFSDTARQKTVKITEIEEKWMGLDIGPETVRIFSEVIGQSAVILWNGPMGVFEFDNFSQGTQAIGKAIAKATSKGAFSLVGGGDSVAAAKKYNLQDQMSYISTGGGAMLEMLEGKMLPGISAVQTPITI